jgi:hypothetical protein
MEKDIPNGFISHHGLLVSVHPEEVDLRPEKGLSDFSRSAGLPV